MKILLVEDESLLANLIARGLASEGWAVEHVESAEVASVRLREERFDVLLLDRMLPGMSGVELCELLRAEQNFIPILMLTALSEVGDRVDGLGAGADDYLSKPFDFDELFARVSALGRRSLQYVQRDVVEALTLGNLDFNPESLQVFQDKLPIDLTAKERELLVFFMRYPNKAFAREDILDQVWGEDADPFSNIVDVYIGKLRRKIISESVQIDTVRGAGYRMTYQES